MPTKASFGGRTSIPIRDRIKELVRVPASSLLPDPRNWRGHPRAQEAALRGVLAEIGFADALIARETPEGQLVLVDGHLRQGVMGDQVVPVLVLDVTEAEAGQLLATLDPISAMAQHDQEKFLSLLDSVTFQDPAVAALLEALANDERQPMPDFSQMGAQPGQDAINARSGELANTFTQRSAEEAARHIPITCPECGKDFSVTRDSLDNPYLLGPGAAEVHNS